MGTGVKVTNILPGCCNTSMYERGVKAIGIPVKDIEETAGKVIQPEDVGVMVWEAVSKPERSHWKL